MTPLPGVSVVVPFRNGAAHLDELMASLALQDIGRPWQVVAVDNGSTDGARQVVQRYGHAFDLMLVDAFGRPNPSFARNAGARRATGSHLLFIDADDVVDRRYVSTMSSALTRTPLVTSRVDSVRLNPAWVRDVHGSPWQETGIGVFFGFLPATGVNIGIRRELFEKLGGFPEEFSGSEDIAFSWIAQLQGGVEIEFVADALYYYRYRNSYRSLFRQSANWGRDTVLLYRRFRADGMPGRTVRRAFADWGTALKGLVVSATPATRATALVALGSCMGRFNGSVRYRVRYL